ncbi:hypothetical protein NC651_017427 [Populus alba x Populus x berolinensis]|nr:hypothetical protein NC651_017427 [Populus alba x Populus x berolinensis]
MAPWAVTQYTHFLSFPAIKAISSSMLILCKMTMMMRRKGDSHMRKRMKNMMRNIEMESIYEKQVAIGAQTAKSTAIATCQVANP